MEVDRISGHRTDRPRSEALASELRASELPEGALEWIRACSPVTPDHVRPMAGGGGARRYWRVSDLEGRTCVFMWALSEDPTILPPALRRPSARLPFVEVAEFLASREVPVPEIYSHRAEDRFVLVEDVGSRHLMDLAGAERERAHERAIDILAHVHGLEAPSGSVPLPYQRHFDREWLAFEARFFLDMHWTEETRKRLEEAVHTLVEYIAGLPRVLSLRDYQSQNLLLDPLGKLRVIDFQDALLAPPGLDLASLLWDSYLPLSETERQTLLRRYSDRAPEPIDASHVAALALHRKAKDLSRYLVLVARTQNPLYQRSQAAAITAMRHSVRSLPREVSDVAEAFERALAELRE